MVSLPGDDAVHDEAIEWWYWTGHLRDEDQRWYGFQVTFFVFDAGMTAMLANVAVTDIDADVYRRAAKFSMGAPTVLEGGFDFELGAQRAEGGGGSDTLHAEAEEYVLDLTVQTDRPAVLQHGDGYEEYSFGGYTYYYSRPRMEAFGTLSVDGDVRTLSGVGWFDHQWGDLANATEYGWDWFAIQLDDDRELMVFSLRFQGVEALRRGSYTDIDCRTTKLMDSDITITATGEWTKPYTNFTFPSGWIIEAAGMTLTVTPAVLDQVLEGFPTYWEGAATVTGDATGRAYVELTGYY